jgi:type 1 fimbria pilin
VLNIENLSLAVSSIKKVHAMHCAISQIWKLIRQTTAAFWGNLVIMKRLTARTMRPIGCAILAALGLTAAATDSAFGADVYGKDFRPFPTVISMPRDTPSNTVVARAHLTPQQLCGEDKCRLVIFRPISFGIDGQGYEVSGPTVITEIGTLAMQVIVNGEPQKRLTDGQSPVDFHSQIEIQLLRNNRGQIPGSVTEESNDRLAFWLFTKTMTGDDRIVSHIRLNTTLTKIEGTCSVPSQTIELPPTRAGSFKGIGTTAAERSFQISINDCPKGYNKIFYRLKPVGDTVETTAGVLPLSPESTAKGVRIRVTDSAAAVVFDTSTRVDDYNTDTGGSFSIPMRVSYVQTEANVTPGTVNGAMSVLMEYQ